MNPLLIVLATAAVWVVSGWLIVESDLFRGYRDRIKYRPFWSLKAACMFCSGLEPALIAGAAFGWGTPWREHLALFAVSMLVALVFSVIIGMAIVATNQIRQPNVIAESAVPLRYPPGGDHHG